MYGETFYGRHTAQHQLQWSQVHFPSYICLKVSRLECSLIWYYKTDQISFCNSVVEWTLNELIAIKQQHFPIHVIYSNHFHCISYIPDDWTNT